VTLPETEACRYLALLDPNATTFTFQTFADRKPPARSDLARVIHSPAWAELLDLHQHGAGVYVCVNETDGRGRKSENILRIRGVWQDDDDSFKGPLPLPPSMVVESSSGRFQRYWLVANDWPADEQGRVDFAGVMARMVESHGSDRNAKDIARVLRVPGFLHRKDKPQLVKIREASGRRYMRAQILAAFPPVAPVAPTISERAVAAIRRPCGDNNAYGQAALDRECEQLAAMAPETGRNAALNTAAYCLGQLYAGGELSDRGEIFDRLIAASHRNRLVGDTSLREVIKTINSGFNAGIKCPRSRKARVSV
jgi:hypothetical protein